MRQSNYMKPCKVWCGAHTEGYGVKKLWGKDWLLHRLTWIFNHGYVTDQVLHKCDNPPCYEEEHLFEGTRTDNMRDCASKGRIRGGPINKPLCSKGHIIDGITKRDSKKRRYCKTCDRLGHKRRYKSCK